MRAVDLIIKNEISKHLSKEEIKFLIDNYTNGAIPDYPNVCLGYGGLP